MSGELRAVSRAAQREKPKALSRKTKAISLAKAVGVGVGVGAAALAIGHMLYTSPSDEEDIKNSQRIYSRAARSLIAKLEVTRTIRMKASEGDRKSRTHTPESRRADAGNKFVLGKYYYDGRGVAVDRRRALRLYAQAATSGHKGAQVELGHLYDHGHEDGSGHLQKGSDIAAAWYRLAATKGPEGAEGPEGSRVSAEAAEAAEAAQRAITEDTIRRQAETWLESRCIQAEGGSNAGDGSNDSWPQSTRYARAAAEAAEKRQFATEDDAKAALTYGAILARDYDHACAHGQATTSVTSPEGHPAFKWYTGALRHHSPADAKRRLAEIHLLARGDQATAERLYQESAAAFNAHAQMWVAEFEPEPTKQIELFQKAAAQGDVGAMVALAQLYLRDDTTFKSISIAKRWCELAIAEGSAEAHFEYGRSILAEKIREKRNERERHERALAHFIVAVDFGWLQARQYADRAYMAYRASAALKTRRGSKSDTQSAIPFQIEPMSIVSKISKLSGIHALNDVIVLPEGCSAPTSTNSPTRYITNIDSRAGLEAAYTSVLSQFDAIAGADAGKYRLHMAPIPFESEQMPEATAHAIRAALRSLPIHSSAPLGTMYVFESYSVVLDYTPAFGLLS